MRRTAALDSAAQDALGAVERATDQAVQRFAAVVGTLQQSMTGFRADRLSVASVSRQMLDSAEMTAGHAYDVGVSAGLDQIARHATFAADIALSAAGQGQIAGAGMRELASALQQVEGLARVIAGTSREGASTSSTTPGPGSMATASTASPTAACPTP